MGKTIQKLAFSSRSVTSYTTYARMSLWLHVTEESAHFRIDISTPCFTLVFYKPQPVGLNIQCHVLQLLYTSCVHMHFHMDHKDSCEYIILYIETKKPQSAHIHFFHTHILYLFLFSLTLFISPTPFGWLPVPSFCLSFFLSFFLSYDSFLCITYSDGVTRLMRPVHCATTWYCAYNLLSFRFWRHQKGR